MTAPSLSAPLSTPRRPTRQLMGLVGYLLLAVLALGLMYVVWGLYVAGEPLFAVVVMALLVGIVIVFGARRFYTARFVFPGVAAVLIFIVLPVAYTTYVGFTNYSARNLLTFDRVTELFLNQKAVDKSTERPFGLVAEGGQYRLLLTEGETGLLSEPFTLDGTPVDLALAPAAELPETLPLKDVVKFRGELGAVTATLPDGSQVSSSGLRSFAKVTPVYEQQADDSLLNRAEGTRLVRDESVGFYRDEAGATVAPGWRVNVGLANFQRVLFSEGIRQPMLQIFLWTITFALLSVFFGFALGILLASVLQWPHLRGKAVYRILLILPYAVPAFISILVFRGLFNQNFGEINLILKSLFGIQPQWFTDPALARTMLIMVNVWLGYPYMMLLSMGFLQSVPEDHKKAAALEGASPIRVFFTITLPQIIPPFLPLLIASFAFNFNNLVLILLLTRGAPDMPGTVIPAGQTDILGSFIYRIGFVDSGQQFGLSGAITFIIFVLVAAIAYSNFVVMRRVAGGVR